MTLASGPSSNFAAIGAGLRSITSVIERMRRASPGDELAAQGHRHDRRVLGAIRHLDADDVVAVVHRTVAEDVLHQARPGIVGFFGAAPARRRRCRATCGDQGQAACASRHGRGPVRTKQFSGGAYSRSVARPLLPFNFRKCCGCVAGIVVVEQLPVRPFRGGRLVGGGPDRLALLVRRPDVCQQRRRGSAARRSSAAGHSLTGP